MKSIIRGLALAAGIIVAINSSNSYANNYGMTETKYAQNQGQYLCDSHNGYPC